jgi:cell division protein ZapA
VAQVTLRISGYVYTVGCEDGQEGHLQAMAEEVEQRITQIKALGGQSGEARLLLLAALLMADELHDLKTDLAQTGAPAPSGPAASPALSKRLERLAAHAEAIAETLARP